MTDIVERLRRMSGDAPDGFAGLADEISRSLNEAADEIERLRECLFQMQNAAIKLANEQRPDPRSR